MRASPAARAHRRVAPVPVLMRVQHWAVTAILGWGVLAFGAVYEWGYWPLSVACAAVGASALAMPRVRDGVPRAVVVALAALVVACALQAISVPTQLLDRISPSTATLLAQYDLRFAQHAVAFHPLSIDPARTWLGLSLLVCLALFWIGLTGTLDERLTLKIVQSVIALGFAVSIAAVVFAGGTSGKVYGLWQPHSPGAPFGPFVNRNHYAGWMLMAVSLGFGYFCGLLNDGPRARARSWRQRIVWLSTAEAGRVILTGLALATMSISVLLSMSRSGIACLAAALAALALTRTRRTFSRLASAAFLSALLLFGVASIAWAGADTLATRFTTWRDDSLESRVAVWQDAGTLIRQFPLAGTGLNTFGVAMLFYQTTHLHELYAEAHNDYLQLAAEGGLLVGVPVLVLIGVTSKTIRRRLRESVPGSRAYWLRVGAVTGLVAIAVQDAGEFSLQMPGNAALFCVLAAVAIRRTPSSAQSAVHP